jgi:hypothetical protein
MDYASRPGIPSVSTSDRPFDFPFVFFPLPFAFAFTSLCIRILWFDEMWSNRPEEEGKVILKAECRLRTFAGAVLSASQRVLAKHGLEEYREKWVQHEFPIKLQAKLQEALG